MELGFAIKRRRPFASQDQSLPQVADVPRRVDVAVPHHATTLALEDSVLVPGGAAATQARMRLAR